MNNDEPDDHGDEIIVPLNEVREIKNEDVPVSDEETVLTPEAEPVSPEKEPTTDRDDQEEDIIDQPVQTDLDDDFDGIVFSSDKIDLRGEKVDYLVKLMKLNEEKIGAQALDTQVKTEDTWDNLIIRVIMDSKDEELRIQEALGRFKEHNDPLSTKLTDETGKTLLRTTPVRTKSPGPGEIKVLTGDDAVLAFQNIGNKKGTSVRLPLYNSGISIDLVTPTGNDIQTLLTNCISVDRELGAANGAHYFTYADVLYKVNLINFIQGLIVNSSYSEWRKKGKLWSVIKLPDLEAIVMTIAAMIYPDGFEGFVVKCTNDNLCKHKETLTINMFEMIITRFSILNKASIDFMVNTRTYRERNNLTQVTKYQEGLNLDGEKVVFGNTSFVMHVPTVAEHIEAGNQFLADIINEIQGDNTEGRYEHMGLRYMRTFLPWISSVEKKDDEGAIYKTSEPKVIVRELELLNDRDPDYKLREALKDYINRSQLTWVGYPVMPCSACGHVADTPSGLYTIDPFSAFFTLAALSLRPTL